MTSLKNLKKISTMTTQNIISRMIQGTQLKKKQQQQIKNSNYQRNQKYYEEEKDKNEDDDSYYMDDDSDVLQEKDLGYDNLYAVDSEMNNYHNEL